MSGRSLGKHIQRVSVSYTEINKKCQTSQVPGTVPGALIPLPGLISDLMKVCSRGGPCVEGTHGNIHDACCPSIISYDQQQPVVQSRNVIPKHSTASNVMPLPCYSQSSHEGSHASHVPCCNTPSSWGSSAPSQDEFHDVRLNIVSHAGLICEVLSVDGLAWHSGEGGTHGLGLWGVWQGALGKRHGDIKREGVWVLERYHQFFSKI